MKRNMPNGLDLTGQRFGRLTVEGLTDRRDCGNRVWRCRCDCGAITCQPTRALRSGIVISCGCNRLERSADNLAGEHGKQIGQTDHTNLSRIASNKIPRNNTSGVRGVSWNKRKSNWCAYIYVQGARVYLGSSQSKSEAVNLRKQAELRYFGELLEKHNWLPGKGTSKK